MLSHYNVGSNVQQIERVFGLNSRDCLLGILPLFHWFGFMGTLALPAIVGVGSVYHPNPLDAKTVGPLVRDYAVTFLLATPTFLHLYLRGCAAEDFGSVRVVMTGAEKLPERLAAAFEEHFGIRSLEQGDLGRPDKTEEVSPDVWYKARGTLPPLTKTSFCKLPIG